MYIALIYDICFSLSGFTLYNQLNHLITLTQMRSFLWRSNVPHVPQPPYPFIGQWTYGRLCVLAVVNSTAVNTAVHVSLSLCLSQGTCPVLGLLGHMVVLFLKNFHTVFYSGCINLHHAVIYSAGVFPFFHILSSMCCL